jgi:hypothetical protein
MSDERIVRLVKRLHDSTQKKKISWEPAPEYKAFIASFPRYSIRIEEQGLDYVIRIINDEGLVVDNFSDEDLVEQFRDASPEHGWSKFMSEIYDMARRQALDADEAIDAILEELE